MGIIAPPSKESIPNGPAGGILNGNYPNPGLSNSVITSANIVNGTITNEDMITAIPPEPSAVENSIVVGTPGISRTVIAAITGNAIATKFIIKHNLGTRILDVNFLSGIFQEPVTMLGSCVSINANEIEVIFTIALGAKAVSYVIIQG
jgi:hypothetical protein